ncbi:uncharacterized protein LOC125703586 isoform X3 [Lagopus muta]|uniref:uncharacterized protein LOC125703586 isoform X3 n=1 Tax=Lagopus muta TaxID=64668 RepID=UPI0020A1A99A|nr:uncharacterized protein LOC125703586 isoform X3 [Lagopus muta]
MLFAWTHWLLLLRKYPQTHLWTLTPTLTLPPQGSGLMLANSCMRTTSRRGIHCRLWQVALRCSEESNSFTAHALETETGPWKEAEEQTKG